MPSILAVAAREVSVILEARAAILRSHSDFDGVTSLQILYRDLMALADRLKAATQEDWDNRDVAFFLTDYDLRLLQELAASPEVYRWELELSPQQRHLVSRFSEDLGRYLRED